MRCLRFGSVRGDLQEGNGCASRCQFPLSLVLIPFLPSTKSAFLCAFAGNQTIGNGSQAVGNGNQTIGNGNQAVDNG